MCFLTALIIGPVHFLGNLFHGSIGRFGNRHLPPDLKVSPAEFVNVGTEIDMLGIETVGIWGSFNLGMGSFGRDIEDEPPDDEDETLIGRFRAPPWCGFPHGAFV